MTFIEWIGFAISLFAMFFLFGKKVKEDRYRRRHPEEAAREEKRKEEAMRKFLKSVHIDVDEEEEEEFQEPPPPPPLQTHIKVNQKPVEARRPAEKYQQPVYSNERNTQRFDKSLMRAPVETKDLAPTYEVKRRQESSKGRMLIERLPSKQMLLVYKELFGPPKAFSNPWDDHS